MDKWMYLPEDELCKLVPEVAGLFFVGCPNCTGGLQENQLKKWSPEEPDKVSCCYCNMSYPNSTYKDSKTQEVITPGGNKVYYPYYENKAGYRYYFTAAVADNKRKFCEEIILKLSQHYKATGDERFARKAALMLYKFSEAWPDYCYHYDYPFEQKEWYNGHVAPEDCKASYRTARWDWWGYIDLSVNLICAYEILINGSFWDQLNKEKNANLKSKIENFFRENADHLLAQKTSLTNMHPYLWFSVVKLGRLLGDLSYLHKPIPDMHRLIAKGFFSDGTWYEGSPDYFEQTLQGILKVCHAYGDWVDPYSYKPGELDFFLDGKPVEEKFAVLKRAANALNILSFPFGERLTLHDSWGWEQYPYPEVPAEYGEKSFLLPALGHACLTGGKGKSTVRADLTWSGGYGHQHMDGLSLMLSAYGHEMLSDIGYTHTKYRSWTLSTVCHNTVVIDNESQAAGSLSEPSDGNLRLISHSFPYVQTVNIENTAVYPGKASIYERTLFMVQTGEDTSYLVDLFTVQGGTQHDYFLHGDCIAEQEIICFKETCNLDSLKTLDAGHSLDTSNSSNTGNVSDVFNTLSICPVETLLPENVDFQLPTGEHQSMDCMLKGYAYGFLKDIQKVTFPQKDWSKFDLHYTGKAIGPAQDVSENGNYVEIDKAEQETGLRIHLQTDVTDNLFIGKNPSVRQSRKDDDLLDSYNRSFIMQRKNAGDSNAENKDTKECKSVFKAIMEPYRKETKIKNVIQLKKDTEGVILKIDWDDKQDYIYFGLKEYSEINHMGKTLYVKGEYGFIRFAGRNICAAWTASGTIGFDAFTLTSGEPVEMELLEVLESEDGGILIITDPDCKMNPTGGEIILLKRNKRTFGFTVKNCIHDQDSTKIFVNDYLGFDYNFSEKVSQDTVFPNQTYKGLHKVEWIPEAVYINEDMK